MFRKLGILGFVLTIFTMLGPSIAEAYPRQYYYRGGRWVVYRGHGHPFRGGYYDRFGRWHRYR